MPNKLQSLQNIFFKCVAGFVTGVGNRFTFAYGLGESNQQAIAQLDAVLQAPEHVDLVEKAKHMEVLVSEAMQKVKSAQELREKLQAIADQLLVEMFTQIVSDFIVVAVNIYFIREARRFLYSSNETYDQMCEEIIEKDPWVNLFHDKFTYWSSTTPIERMILKLQISEEIRRIERKISDVKVAKEKAQTKKVVSGFLLGIDLVMLVTGVGAYMSTWSILGKIRRIASAASTLSLVAVGGCNAKILFRDIPQLEITLGECHEMLVAQSDLLTQALNKN